MIQKIFSTTISALVLLPVWLITGCGGGESEAQNHSNIISNETTHIQLTVRDGLNPDPSQRTKVYKRVLSELASPARDVLYSLETTNDDLHCSEDGTQYEMIITSQGEIKIYTSNNNWCNREPAPTGYIALESLSTLASALKSE